MTDVVHQDDEEMSVNITDDFDTSEVFRNLMRHTTVGTTGETKSEIRAVLTDWLGVDPVTLPGFSDNYWGLLQINFQAGLDAFLAEPGREGRVHGVHTPTATGNHDQVPFSRLLSPPSFKWGGASLGLVDYQLRASGYRKQMRCIDRGLVLFRDAEGAGAIWITHYGQPQDPLYLEVLTTPAERAPQLIRELRRLGEEASPYKGEMFRVRTDDRASFVEFLPRPEGMTADDIILPDGVLKRIDQHTVLVSRRRTKLKRLGMHLKRGILLHGPPGTGKTHTIRYLASRMRDSTVVILPKKSIGLAHIFMPIVEPAIVVLDDVDLIAENRSMPAMADKELLFQALEALDGMLDTDDVLFVLSTNRADTMEPAIAARPGRVDQTIEIPRPDDECRRRLFELYCRGADMQIDERDVEEILDRTKGVTASFFKELLRRAMIKAVVDGVEKGADGRVPVDHKHVFEALDRMLDPTNPMTRQLLGAEADLQRPTTVSLKES